MNLMSTVVCKEGWFGLGFGEIWIMATPPTRGGDHLRSREDVTTFWYYHNDIQGIKV